jgi:hypothetical protein
MRDQWNRTNQPGDGGDCRKLVTLEQDGMIWVGIRAYGSAGWVNNGRIETAKVLAWQDLPQPAYSDDLMQPMAGPTLPAGDL